MHLLILPGSRSNFLPETIDLSAEPGDLLQQKAGQRADRFRQIQVRIVKRRRQALDMDRTLGSNDAELSKMAAPGQTWALIVWVRWRTRRSRVPNSMPRACCSAVFTATKFMVGRDAASQHAPDYDPGIASASAASFFCRLT